MAQTKNAGRTRKRVRRTLSDGNSPRSARNAGHAAKPTAIGSVPRLTGALPGKGNGRLSAGRFQMPVVLSGIPFLRVLLLIAAVQMLQLHIIFGNAQSAPPCP